MPTQDRVLLSLAGMSGCVSVWLVFQSVTQWTLRSTASPGNIVFLAVVTFTIVAILLSKKRRPSLARPSGRVRINRLPILLVGGLAALGLAGLSVVFDQLEDTGSETILVPPEASLAGFAGLVILLLLLRLMFQRIQGEPDEELAPGVKDSQEPVI